MGFVFTHMSVRTVTQLTNHYRRYLLFSPTISRGHVYYDVASYISLTHLNCTSHAFGCQIQWEAKGDHRPVRRTKRYRYCDHSEMSLRSVAAIAVWLTNRDIKINVECEMIRLNHHCSPVGPITTKNQWREEHNFIISKRTNERGTIFKGHQAYANKYHSLSSPVWMRR